MSDTVTAVIDGKRHKLATSDLTLVFKDRKLTSRVEYEDLFRIEPQDAHKHGMEAAEVDHLALRFTAHVFDLDPNSLTLEACRGMSREVIQVVGMFDMAMECMRTGTRYVLVEPEAGLHPSHQLRMADVFILLSGHGTLDSLEGLK